MDLTTFLANTDALLLAVIGMGLVGLLYAVVRVAWIARQDAGDAKMATIAKHISEGSMAFLGRQYKVLIPFVVVVAALLYFLYSGSTEAAPVIAVAFVAGALCSALAGYFGMKAATLANVRTAAAARTSLSKALDVSFAGGAVMGLTVVGIAMVGLAGLILIFKTTMQISFSDLVGVKYLVGTVSGFSLGASSIALFARVGGGIYTKAADVGADLVGKLEAGIPEDDPRNPAVIADNVGDNVGDVAGMGADLFESYIAVIVAAMVIGIESLKLLSAVTFPILIGGVGVIVSIVACSFVRTRENGDPQKALNIGTFSAGILMLVATYFLAKWVLPVDLAFGSFVATVVGLVGGIAIGMVTEYYTSKDRKPVLTIAKESTTGAATNLISGLNVGMRSTAIPMIILVGVILAAYEAAALYGLAMAAIGMLSTTGIQMAVDAYGPIADNAGGIAEMAGLPKEVRERTDRLDAVGNTTAAIGKGFATSAAALAGLALITAFAEKAHLTTIDLLNPKVTVGLFIGAMVPFLFSAMTIKAVGQAAFAMIEEVRRQFKTIPGLMEGKADADYARCVDISTKGAIRQMILPGLLTIVSPIVVGVYDLGALGGFLAGTTVTGFLMAVFQSNAGGAWDNAKKYIESGHLGGKGSDAHKAAVVGDTVGDPLKDTSGCSLNILIKLVGVVSLILAPLLVG